MEQRLAREMERADRLGYGLLKTYRRLAPELQQRTVEDLRAGRSFEDAVARGAYVLDAHSPDDDKRTTMIPREERAVPPYQVPFGAIVAAGVENLAAAGRCISADQLALSSARVTTTSSMTGQAAGIAAAMAADRGCALAALDGAEVRRAVEQRGAVL